MVDRYVLEGRLVTMDDSIGVIGSGRVYVDGAHIAAVQPAEAPAPEGWDQVRVVRTGDTIYPGLIELHNHLAYDALPLWRPPQRFANRGQWMRHPEYRRFVSGPARVLGRTRGLIEAVARYVEAKCLFGGVTTSQGVTFASNAGARRYFRGLVRNVEDPGDDEAMPAAATRVDDVDAGDAEAFLRRLEQLSSRSLLLHLAEGLDDAAREHFRALRIGPDRWAITPALSGIHCAALGGRDFQIFRARGGSMVWSPLSNLLLYGGTARIEEAAEQEVPMALGSDWSPSGSKNLLAELKVAWLHSQARGDGDVFSARQLVEMVTVNPARMLKWDSALGSITPGKRADLIAVDGRGGDPYEHLLRARESSLTLVVVDGAPRCGQPRLMAPFLDGRTVERRDVGGAERIVDLTDAAADPLVGDLSLDDAERVLADGLQNLPELARQLEDPVRAASLLGSVMPGEEGAWFVELDHDEMGGWVDRPAFGGLDVWHAAAGDGAGNGAGGGEIVLPPWLVAAAQPLSEVLVPLDLDPLTVVDDERYVDRLAAVPDLSDEAFEVVRGLARLYGRTPPSRRDRRRRRAERGAPETAPRVELGEAAAGRATATPLADFLTGIGEGALSLADRQVLVEQAQVMLEQCYVHLVLKRSMHAVDPVQRLRLLGDRLAMLSDETRGSEVAFHREMAEIFASVRDLHTNYILPAPFRGLTAYLPFMVERYHDAGEGGRPGAEHFIVTRLAAGLEHPTFVPEVEVLHWNGTPVRRVVEANARVQAGSNPAASFARGLAALTQRPLVRSLPPDEDWVVVTYRGLDGVERDIRFDWHVAAGPIDWGEGTGMGVAARAALGLDLEMQAINEARKVMFAPRAVQAEADIASAATEVTRVAVASEDVDTSMPTVFRARPVATPSGTFGHIRVFTFNVPDADVFVDEFVRLAERLPQDGLIVDVRGNGGGLIYASERLLQVLTPREIVPEPTQMITTPLMLDLCQRHDPSPLDRSFDLAPWVPSLRQAVATGAHYSNAFPITSPGSANARGQRYHGPVVLVTDALCYSATDIFAAGFQDHRIGPVLGVDGNTGAGGANVWTHDLLRQLLASPRDDGSAPNPFVELPGGAGFRASVRRTLRVSDDRAGTPVEDIGVVPDVRHHLTRDDLLHGNVDLLARAGALLRGAPRHRLALDGPAEARPDGRVRLRLVTAGLDRVDVAFDGRPVGSLDVEDRTSSHTLRPASASPAEVELTGWAGGEVVARRKEPVREALPVG